MPKKKQSQMQKADSATRNAARRRLAYVLRCSGRRLGGGIGRAEILAERSLCARHVWRLDFKLTAVCLYIENRHQMVPVKLTFGRNGLNA